MTNVNQLKVNFLNLDSAVQDPPKSHVQDQSEKGSYISK